MAWEKYKKQPHDHWWANFVRAGRIRTEQIRAQDPNAQITWLVYKQGLCRSRGAGKAGPDRPHQHSVRDKYNLKLIYFNKGDEVINYLNNGQPRDRVKIANFEFFGHSNAKCFMFDYSSTIESACKSWLHENELTQNQPRASSPGTRSSRAGAVTPAKACRRNGWPRIGIPMWGVIGKTQYMMDELPVLSSKNGKWVTR